MLRNGEGKKLKPVNLEPLEGEAGRVHCFWGAAQWYALYTRSLLSHTSFTPPFHAGFTPAYLLDDLRPTSFTTYLTYLLRHQPPSHLL